jgi:hypothetical protein
MSTSFRLLSAAALLVTIPTAAQATLVLDAHYNPADTTHVSAVTAPPNYGVEDTGQTITIEHSGTLVELDLLLERGVNAGAPSGNLHWAIRPTASGLPGADASALLSGDIAAANINADAPNKT